MDNNYYDTRSFSDPIGFDDLEEGQRFPPFSYRVTKDHARFYMESVGEQSEEMLEYIPSLAAFSYGFFYSAMKKRPPTGYINSAVDLQFLQKVPADAPLTMEVTVDKKFQKRERKFIVFRLDVRLADGSMAGTALVDCIFPN